MGAFRNEGSNRKFSLLLWTNRSIIGGQRMGCNSHKLGQLSKACWDFSLSLYVFLYSFPLDIGKTLLQWGSSNPLLGNSRKFFYGWVQGRTTTESERTASSIFLNSRCCILNADRCKVTTHCVFRVTSLITWASVSFLLWNSHLNLLPIVLSSWFFLTCLWVFSIYSGYESYIRCGINIINVCDVLVWEVKRWR